MPANLARLLVEGGILSRAAVDDCLRRHLQVGGSLDTVLLEAEVVREDVLLQFLAQAADRPAALAGQFLRPDPKIFTLFPYKLAERHGMVPIEMGKRHLDVACCYPVEQMLVEELSFMLGRDLRPRVAVEVRVREAIARLYDKPLAPRFATLVKRLGSAPTQMPDLAEARSAKAQASVPVAAPALTAGGKNVGAIASWPPRPATPAPLIAGELIAPAEELPILEAEPAAPVSEPPLLEVDPLAQAEEDAAALLGEAPPPRRGAVTMEVEIPIEIEPAAPLNGHASAPMPRPSSKGATTLEMPMQSGEEDVRIGDDLLLPPEAPAPAAAAEPEPPILAGEVEPEPAPAANVVAAAPVVVVANAEPAPVVVVANAEPAPVVVVAPAPAEESVVFDDAHHPPEPAAPVEESVVFDDAHHPPEPTPIAAAEGTPTPLIEAPPVIAAEPEPIVAPPAVADAPPAAVVVVDLSAQPAPVAAAPSAEASVLLPPEGVPDVPAAQPAVEAPALAAPAPEPAPVEEPVVFEDEPSAAETAEEPVVFDDEPAAPPPLPHRAPTSPEDARPVTPNGIAPPRPMADGAAQANEPLASRAAWETRETLTAWRPADDGLGSLEDMLGDIVDNLDPSLFGPPPEAVAPMAPVPAAHAAAAEAVQSVAAQAPSLVRTARPPSVPTSPHIPAWTLSEARARLAAAPERDAIIEVALRFALKSFDFAAALAIRSGTAFGWAALSSDGQTHEQVHRLALPLDAQSVLRTVLRAKGRYLGPLPSDDLTLAMLADLGREPPTVAMLYPVFVRERPVAIFYADRGRKHVAAPRVAEFLLFAQELATAFERAILANKQRAIHAVADASMLPAPPAVESAPAPSAATEALDEEPFFPIDEEPPVYERRERALDEILLDLTGSDRKKRLAALVELEPKADQAAPALAKRFPGPTALRRGPVVDLPDPEELGPVIAALGKLAPVSIPYVERLLRDGDPDQRFFAALLAGSLRHPELFDGLRRALFDAVPEVASAARAAAAAARSVDGFEQVVAQPVRSELSSPDPDRVASAALAVGRTRDEQAIPLLIPLTGHADDRVAAEASDALTQITKQTHGDSPRRWLSWWEHNKDHPRVAWLVEGLAHKDLQIRLSSIEELMAVTSDALGYVADGPRRDREKALERWDHWLKTRLN